MLGRLRQIRCELREHSLDGLDLTQQGFARLRLERPEVGRDHEVTLGFGCGAQRNLKEPYGFFPRAFPAALCDVCRNRDRGPTKLPAHYTMICARKALRANVYRHRELPRTLANCQSSEIVHAKRVRSARRRRRTLATLVSAFGRE